MQLINVEVLRALGQLQECSPAIGQVYVRLAPNAIVARWRLAYHQFGAFEDTPPFVRELSAQIAVTFERLAQPDAQQYVETLVAQFDREIELRLAECRLALLPTPAPSDPVESRQDST